MKTKLRFSICRKTDPEASYGIAISLINKQALACSSMCREAAVVTKMIKNKSCSLGVCNLMEDVDR